LADVQTQHKCYTKSAPIWKRCRDVIEGGDAVKAAGATYLPKLRDQEAQDYKDYLMRAPFYNATARTASGFVGMLFRKPPTQAVPDGLTEVLNDVDLCGTPFAVFAHEVAEECVEIGRVGVLVDYPVAIDSDGPLTKAVAERLNLRPSMKIYEAETIINWKFKRIKNVWKLSMVVLTEEVEVPDTEFKSSCETHYRVLDLMNDEVYRQRVFRINKDRGEQEQIGSDIFPKINNQTMDEIPFIVMTPDGVTFDDDEPPLLDLVDINLSHYRTSADYEHGCHFTALPTLFLSGHMPEVVDNGEAPAKIYLGSQAAIVETSPDANAKFIEFTGQGLNSLVQNLDRKESQMAVLGARMLAAEKKQVEQPTTAAIHRTGENSILSDISIAVSIGLSRALTIFAAWAGVAGECTYKLNRDFLPLNVDGQTLTSWVAAWQAGAISEEELFDLLQRGDVVEADLTIEEHRKGKFQDPAPATINQPGKQGVNNQNAV